MTDVDMRIVNLQLAFRIPRSRALVLNALADGEFKPMDVLKAAMNSRSGSMSSLRNATSEIHTALIGTGLKLVVVPGAGYRLEGKLDVIARALETGRWA